MNAKELMLGNFILDASGKPIKVTAQRIADIDNNLVIANPILITEDILLKCGFRILDKYTFVSKNIFIYHRRVGFKYGRSLMVNNLHQLQNLYFALTNKELEVSL